MISVLLATTDRPIMAERCVLELRDTADDLEIVAAIDNDSDTVRRLTPLIDGLSYSDEYRGCSKAWNDALALSTGDPVVLAADDLRWRLGWDEAALKTMAKFPDGWGMVGFNDGHWGEELSTHYMLSRRFVIEVLGGRIAWECYTHSFNDREVNDRARRAGRYAWCEDAHVYHDHWIFGDRIQDESDRRNLPGWDASNREYERRMAEGFPEEFEPVIGYHEPDKTTA